MSKDDSFSLDERSEALINGLYATGRYRSARDGVGATPWPLEERGTPLIILREAMITGENSGTSTPFDFNAFVSRKRAKGFHTR